MHDCGTVTSKQDETQLVGNYRINTHYSTGPLLPANIGSLYAGICDPSPLLIRYYV